MSQKKNKQARAAATKTASPSKANTQTRDAQQAPAQNKKGLMIGIAAALLIGAVVIVSIVSGSNGNGGAPGAGGTVQPSAEEAAYIGRLLPAGYTAPSVAAAASYDSAVEMTELTLAGSDASLTVPVADLVNAKISLLQYTLPSGEALPLIAYLKPSGALFVGVSFCPPCQGEWQTIQPDGTLTCNSCGTKRDLETQAGISGACKLYPLDEIPVTLTDGNVVIDRAVLDSWTPQPLDRAVG